MSDDGLPQNGQLTIGWSVLSSSGAFSINHSSQVTTSLSFALPGNYLLQLTATDGELAASDEILITVNAEAEKQIRFPTISRSLGNSVKRMNETKPRNSSSIQHIPSLNQEVRFITAKKVTLKYNIY